MNIEDPKIVDEKFLSKKCAWLYYVAKLNQNQIAKKIGLSKMRVHRLIAFAEKNGFVKTFVEGGFDKTTKYEEIIKQKYNLKISFFKLFKRGNLQTHCQRSTITAYSFILPFNFCRCILILYYRGHETSIGSTCCISTKEK